MNRSERPAIIVVTGAESTGKSALTRQLSKHLLSPGFPEYARDWIMQIRRHYDYHDVELIAYMQRSQMQIAGNLKSDFVFFDTWLIITEVWFEVVYGKVPEWISGVIRKATIDLFLVCDTDIPWIPDLVRENGGEMREVLSEIYKNRIREYGFRYETVTGTGAERLQNALDFLQDIR